MKNPISTQVGDQVGKEPEIEEEGRREAVKMG
jgi:hypothetical protein